MRNMFSKAANSPAGRMARGLAIVFGLAAPLGACVMVEPVHFGSHHSYHYAPYHHPHHRCTYGCW